MKWIKLETLERAPALAPALIRLMGTNLRAGPAPRQLRVVPIHHMDTGKGRGGLKGSSVIHFIPLLRPFPPVRPLAAIHDPDIVPRIRRRTPDGDRGRQSGSGIHTERCQRQEGFAQGFRRPDVVLYFYPKDDTPGCTKRRAVFATIGRTLQKMGTVVLGVSADTPESHQKFAAKYKLPFPLLSDPDRKVMQQYGAYGEKMMYGKKTVGVIRSTVLIGPDGKVKKHWARVASAEQHPAKVLEVIRGRATA
jgi:peroxiredoxin Q/BCP